MKSAGQAGADPVDWQDVRQKLAAAAKATEEALSPSSVRAAAILAERAGLLARRETRSAAAARIELVVFTLSRERYGIETRYAREVVRLASVTPVPGAPEILLGLTNLRGEILPVFDSRRLFGLDAKGLSDLSRLVVLGESVPEFAVLADRVEDIAEIALADIVPSPLGEGARPYVRGVTRDALVVLDGGRLLADPELFIGRGKGAADARSPQ